eukprot:352738-Chlamydomonas_euryale.AAC.6
MSVRVPHVPVSAPPALQQTATAEAWTHGTVHTNNVGRAILFNTAQLRPRPHDVLGCGVRLANLHDGHYLVRAHLHFNIILHAPSLCLITPALPHHPPPSIALAVPSCAATPSPCLYRPALPHHPPPPVVLPVQIRASTPSSAHHRCAVDV